MALSGGERGRTRRSSFAVCPSSEMGDRFVGSVPLWVPKWPTQIGVAEPSPRVKLNEKCPAVKGLFVGWLVMELFGN